MRAAVLHSSAIGSESPLKLERLPASKPGAGEVLLRVEACGVCRTDLHIAMGELKPLRDRVIPGHQIVGRAERVGAGVAPKILGQRVGVSWLGGVDGTCPLCRKGRENLCDHPVFTGYSVNGGYAEYATARADFLIPLPGEAPAEELAPLLCAGIIGYRALRVAGVDSGERVGIFGFGSSAHLAIEVLRAWGCETYVATRGRSHRALARKMGAVWVGDALDQPPVAMDRAVTFAPSGDVVLAALASLRKGGVVAINAIHLDRIPEFPYELLWWERQLRSVANVTRTDVAELLELAASLPIVTQTEVFDLADAGEALARLAAGDIRGAAVLEVRP